MADNRGAITGHFITHWGIPKEIRPRRAQAIEEFAILEFPPRGTRKSWRYATNGMSSYLQRHPDPHVTVFTEIYACTSESVVWVDDLLEAIASYPQHYSTYLAEGDTIALGQAIDRKESCYTGILLAPPNPIEPATLGLIGGISENVLVHQIVGLLQNEIE